MNPVEPVFWQHALDGVDMLSPRFRCRYARVLARLSADAASASVSLAFAAVKHNPLIALRHLLGLGLDRHPGGCQHGAVEVVGRGPVAHAVQAILTCDPCVECAFARHPALEQTWVPLHPSRRARYIATSQAGPLVAVTWPADSVPARTAHRRTVQHLAEIANRDLPAGVLRLAAPDECVLIRQGEGVDLWSVSPNYGTTLEDELRLTVCSTQERAQVVRALARLRAVMVEEGVVWQGFAPRNMFRRDGEIILIDFEEATSFADNPLRAAEMLLWHRVFFADCLTAIETEQVFRPVARCAEISEAAVLAADSFERALLRAETVTWGERRALLTQSINLEGRHARPGAGPRRDAGVLYGHELGHFWGDFLPVAVETRIFHHLSALTDPRQLASCLEVFEAAMEADIDRMLLNRAADTIGAGCARTAALAEALDRQGSVALVAARANITDWYPQLERDPAALVDRVLFHPAAPRDVGTAPEQLLVGSAAVRKQHTDRLTQAVEAGLGFVHGDERDGRFLDYADPESLRTLLSGPVPLAGADFDTVLADVQDTIVRYSIAQGHPGYLAFPDSGNSVAALAGAILAPLLNQNLIAVDRSAPAATFATVQVVEWLRGLLGFDASPVEALRGVRDVAGLWTTGGHLSNHVAMLAALGKMFPQVRQHGVRTLASQPVVVMAGAIAHYSHSDAAYHLGLGWDAIIPVQTRPDFTTDPNAVDAVLADPPAGTRPFMVIGVAGNCRTTGLDDLRALAEVCRRYGVWFHVDACHGGSLLFNDRLRTSHLAGIEQADSVSLDPHKGLFTPYPSSYVLFRERAMLTQFSRHTDTVMQDGVWDLGLVTPFLGSCAFGALPTWMMLKHIGTTRLGELVDARHLLIQHLERRIDDAGLFVRLNDVDFYRLTFVLCPPSVRETIIRLPDERRRTALSAVNHFTSQLNSALYEAGGVCFDEHTLVDLSDRVGLGTSSKFVVLAACPGNALTTLADLEHSLTLLSTAARPLAKALAEAIGTKLDLDTAPRRTGPAGWEDEE
jgi:glutamate/tyrosine decarboxylase-like PLP-dependent enzyme